MKKVLFLILASFLVLGACGNKEESSDENDKTNKENKKLKEQLKEQKKENKNLKSRNEEKPKNNKQNDNTTVKNTNANSKKNYVKSIKSYQGQLQIIGEDVEKLSNEIDDNNQLTPKGEELLTSIKTQLNTASNTLNDKNLKAPKKYKQDHEDLIYGDELINKGIEGMSSGDSEAYDNMDVGVSIASDAIQNITK